MSSPSPKPSTGLPQAVPYQQHTTGPLTYFEYYFDSAPSVSSHRPPIVGRWRSSTVLILGVLSVMLLSGLAVAYAAKQIATPFSGISGNRVPSSSSPVSTP